MKQTTAPTATPSPQSHKRQEVGAPTDSPSSVFIAMALDMSWRLALIILLPIIGGAELDKLLESSPVLLFIGLGIAVIGIIFVLRQALQKANARPVKKLTVAERREVRKRYEEDDD